MRKRRHGGRGLLRRLLLLLPLQGLRRPDLDPPPPRPCDPGPPPPPYPEGCRSRGPGDCRRVQRRERGEGAGPHRRGGSEGFGSDEEGGEGSGASRPRPPSRSIGADEAKGSGYSPRAPLGAIGARGWRFWWEGREAGVLGGGPGQEIRGLSRTRESPGPSLYRGVTEIGKGKEEFPWLWVRKKGSDLLRNVFPTYKRLFVVG